MSDGEGTITQEVPMELEQAKTNTSSPTKTIADSNNNHGKETSISVEENIQEIDLGTNHTRD